MPNPFKQRSVTAMSDSEYYNYYFSDRNRHLDKHAKQELNQVLQDSAEALGVDKHKRERLGPKKYWYNKKGKW